MITTTRKRFLKAPFRAVGLDLVVRRPYPLEFLASYGIRTILDVGAHEGGFAEDVRAILPTAMLHSFEPVRETFQRLRRRQQWDPNFRAWQLAIGDQNGQATIQVNAMSASSSLLPLGTITKHYPQTEKFREETVLVSTLDDWSRDLELPTPILLKADVQGFEGSVVAGATSLLRRVVVVLLEVSFEEFYLGQPLFEAIYDQMRRAGFVLKGMYDPAFDPQTARQLQSNAIFERDPASRGATTPSAEN